jgi:tRNA pseudouridine55 synthase
LSGGRGCEGPDRASDGWAGALDGLALLDKPVGITSFQALAAVKRALGTGRVGHTGTLDPFASGLLVALTGRYTRLAPLLAGQDKSYRARVRFGEETATLDPEGEVVAAAPPPDRSALSGVLPRFVGEIEQVPPLYSAVHHEGERAYRLARRGERPALAPRRVRVESLELVGYDPPFADLRVRCSAGTYVRSLARDIALACGSRATVVELARTAVGPFTREEAVAPQAFEPGRLLAARSFLPRLGGVASAVVEGQAAARVAAGALPRPQDLGPWPGDARATALFGRDGRLLAVLERTDGPALRFVAVFAGAN